MMLLTRAGLGAKSYWMRASVLSLVIIISPAVALAQVATSSATTTNNIVQATPALDPHDSSDVEAAVRAYFADIPVMIAIADCESDFTQLNSSGSALNGGSGGMIGVYQVNRSVHAKFALTLGDDINTLKGNMAYARYLYTNEGTVPWNSSKFCWSKQSLPAAALSKAVDILEAAVLPSVAKASAQVVETAAAVPATQNATQSLSQNLKLGSVSSQVKVLQKLLNDAGFVVAKAGAGSPGNETDTFGGLTKAAVQRFQCAQNIVCKGSEATTGYGLVGAKTRAALVLN